MRARGDLGPLIARLADRYHAGRLELEDVAYALAEVVGHDSCDVPWCASCAILACPHDDFRHTTASCPSCEAGGWVPL